MTLTKPFHEIAADVYDDPEAMEEVAVMVAAMMQGLALAEVREEAGRTQAELADTLDVSQANVSRIERQDDLYLSTLREYVEALGGKLEIRAVFPDRVVTLDPRKRPPKRGGKGRAAR